MKNIPDSYRIQVDNKPLKQTKKAPHEYFLRRLIILILAFALLGCTKQVIEPTQCYECLISIQTKGYQEKQIWTRIIRTPEGMREFERKGTISDAASRMITTCYHREK